MKNNRGISVLTLIIAVALCVLCVPGCSLSTGTDMPERTQIFKVMESEGFIFSHLNLSTAYGSDEDQIIVTGRMAQRKPDNSVVANGFKLTQFTKVVVEKGNNAWKIASAIKLER